MNRRKFLEFLGGAALTGAGATLWARTGLRNLLRTSQFPSQEDQLLLADGLSYEVILKWEDRLNARGERFGFNCDFNAFLKLTENEALLWTNHEEADSLFISGGAAEELKSVGGSLTHIVLRNGHWALLSDSPRNRRWDGFTEIPFAWSEPIDGARVATGTIANCSGGVTPWGTFLSCEENYQVSFGEYQYASDGSRSLVYGGKGWRDFSARSPEHYGWVVEIDPRSNQSKKLIALGRFSHEGSLVVEAPDGRAVVYMGDDGVGECLYKFISDQPGSLEHGVLYVANTLKGEWLPLDWHQNEILRANFSSQTQVLIRARQAARLLGGTPLDRPEGITVHPRTGAIYISLTNNVANGNPFGSLLRIDEHENDPRSGRFSPSVAFVGGPEAGFACPDNIVFDRKGNLWMTSDMPSDKLGRVPYTPFGNNGLFVVPSQGPRAGEVCQVGSAPVEAELTGPCFSSDGRTLFLSVQHPGEESPSLDRLHSHWPDGAPAMPRPSVLAITGPLLEDPGAWV